MKLKMLSFAMLATLLAANALADAPPVTLPKSGTGTTTGRVIKNTPDKSGKTSSGKSSSSSSGSGTATGGK